MDEQKNSNAWAGKETVRVKKFLSFFLVVVSIFFIAKTVNEFRSGALIGSGVPASNIISVSGTGDVSAIPDVATFTLTVTKEDKSVSVAQQSVTDKMNTVLAALKDTYKIDDKDIKTTAYDIQPNYDYVQSICTVNGCGTGRQVLRDYSVSHTISVKVRDTAKAGDILAAVGALNVNYVSGLTFSIDKMDDLNAQARKAAIDQAQEKAKVLAKDLGVTLVRIVSFSENGGATPIYYDRGMMSSAPMMMSEKAATPDIPQGENKITSSVTISYEIR